MSRRQQNQDVSESPLDDYFNSIIGSSNKSEALSEAQIARVAELLESVEQQWSICPRTYILLRIIGRLDLFPVLIESGFTDLHFPVGPRDLPVDLDQQCRNEIRAKQAIICTRGMSIEKEDGAHWYLGANEELPLISIDVLGRGAYSEVDRVRSKISHKCYARKRIFRGVAHGSFRQRQKVIEQYSKEMQLLKSIKHRHIVQFVGSYTDSRYFAILMSPVADGNLTAFMASVPGSPSKKQTLRGFYGCLANSLQYLHDNGIRHRDIKPDNILVHETTVLLTDFGISLDYKNEDSWTTSGPTEMTPTYCAPEVAAGTKRNMSADIWSLGCVFLEMTSVLKGHTLESRKAFFLAHGANSTSYHNNQGAMLEWLSLLRQSTPLDSYPIIWIEQMLQQDRRSRPTAARIFEETKSTSVNDAYGQRVYCALCCAIEVETDDDSEVEDTVEDTNEDKAADEEESRTSSADIAMRLDPGPEPQCDKIALAHHRTLDPPLEVMRAKAATAMAAVNNIADTLNKTLIKEILYPTKCQPGHVQNSIYVLRCPTGHMRILEQSYKERHGCACERKAAVVHTLWSEQAKMVQSLVHAELKIYKTIWMCLSCSRLVDALDIPQKKAVEVTHKWVEFMAKRPYDDDNSLKPEFNLALEWHLDRRMMGGTGIGRLSNYRIVS